MVLSHQTRESAATAAPKHSNGDFFIVAPPLPTNKPALIFAVKVARGFSAPALSGGLNAAGSAQQGEVVADVVVLEVDVLQVASALDAHGGAAMQYAVRGHQQNLPSF